MLKTMTWLLSSPLQVGMDRFAAGWPHASTLVVDVFPYCLQLGSLCGRHRTYPHIVRHVRRIPRPKVDVHPSRPGISTLIELFPLFGAHFFTSRHMAYHPPPTSFTPLPNVVVPYVLRPPKIAPHPVLPLISAEHVLLPIVPVWYAVRS